ncbi:flavodoxin family protein [Spirochaetota bacterium]
MKVIAFNGSPRKGGNTSILIKEVLKPIKKQGIETETIQVGGKNVRGCIACYKCVENKDNECSVKNDIINDCIKKVIESDAIILGSPCYFTNVTSELKALIDRLGLVSIANGGFLRRKVGAAVVAVRRGGAIHAFDSINHLFQMTEMFVVGSTYWNFALGRNPGEVSSDEEGIKNMNNLGENIAWLLKKINS